MSVQPKATPPKAYIPPPRPAATRPGIKLVSSKPPSSLGQLSARGEDFGSYPLASPTRRLIALLIDGPLSSGVSLVAGVVFGILFGLAGLGSSFPAMIFLKAVLPFFVIYGYFVVPVAWYGQTLGKKIMGVKVVCSDDGDELNLTRASGREAARILSAVSLMVGYLMAYFRDDRKTLHDILAGTKVISLHREE